MTEIGINDDFFLFANKSQPLSLFFQIKNKKIEGLSQN
jgi:hypothetical protein